MPRYLVIWRYSEAMTGGRWDGENTVTHDVEADSPIEAVEVAGSRLGELLVLPYEMGEEFAIQATIHVVPQ